MTWSKHSRRMEPIKRSTTGFCQGGRGAVSFCSMPGLPEFLPFAPKGQRIHTVLALTTRESVQRSTESDCQCIARLDRQRSFQRNSQHAGVEAEYIFEQFASKFHFHSLDRGSRRQRDFRNGQTAFANAYLVSLHPSFPRLSQTSPAFRPGEETLEIFRRVAGRKSKRPARPVELPARQCQQQRPRRHRARVVAAAFDLAPRVSLDRRTRDAVVAIPRGLP